MCNEARCKDKNHFRKYYLQCFSRKGILEEHRVASLEINGKQTVKLRRFSIKSKNHFKQLAAPFKIYAGFEYNVKIGVVTKIIILYISKNIKDTFLAVFFEKVVCVDNEFSKPVVLNRGKNMVYILIDTIPTEYDYCKKVIKKQFNKNLVTFEKNKQIFQSSNKCCIREKSFGVREDTARGHWHVT